jgi:hypothetical protein
MIATASKYKEKVHKTCPKNSVTHQNGPQSYSIKYITVLHIQELAKLPNKEFSASPTF